MARPIVFLSDYGLDDQFVGICHGVVASLSPESRLIDLTHGIPPRDVLRGAIVLAESMLYMPKDSVFLAVVDPGVGTDRRPVAVEDEAGFLTVGPDNGLLSMAWVGGPRRAVEITSPDAILTPTSRTFHGRDIFAPAAALLARGMPMMELGPEVLPTSLVRMSAPAHDVDNGEIRCRVLGVDRFGNVQLSLRPEDLREFAMESLPDVVISRQGEDFVLPRVSTFGELDPGEDGILVDSSGSIAIVRNAGNAAKSLDLQPGDDVVIRRPRRR